jgi:hypothetical protein
LRFSCVKVDFALIVRDVGFFRRAKCIDERIVSYHTAP